MSRTYVPVELRRAVLERAGGRCEYCLYPQALAFIAFEVDKTVLPYDLRLATAPIAR